MKTFLLKASKSLLPCFLLTTAIGFCYAFSLFAAPVRELLGVSKTAVQFAFCLNIFFLGTGASCFGALVEKNIKKAAWLSTALLFAGLGISGVAMHMSSIWLFYLGIGVCCGLSEGIGYVVPVKNLLLWLGKSKHKALVMAISIVSFGLGSTFCTWIFKYTYPMCGIHYIFFFFAIFYLATMSIGSILIDKPKFAKIAIEKTTSTKKYLVSAYLKDSYFWQCWLFMFLNISMGLVIIGQCAGMLTSNNVPTSTMLVVMMLCGLSNGFGRLVFPAVSDYLKNRVDTLLAALVLEMAVFIISIFYAPFIPIAFIIVNACYGCFFALLPGVLLDHYGKSELSFVHGLVLQAWASASLFAFLVSTFVLSVLAMSQNVLFAVLVAVYAINFINVYIVRHRNERQQLMNELK